LNNPLLGQMLGSTANAGPLDAGTTLTPRAPAPTSRIRVEADVRNNAVLIYDLPERQAMYRELIAQLDVARKLVEIDAIILDIERTQLREFGVNWGFQNSRFRGGANVAPGTSSQLSIEHRERFYADIRALEAKGLATMVSNPSVLTLENQPAVIDFNRTQFLTPGRENATILPVTVGTSFQVVPRVITSRGSHQIHLVVDIEDGNFDETDPTPGNLDVRRGKHPGSDGGKTLAGGGRLPRHRKHRQAQQGAPAGGYSIAGQSVVFLHRTPEQPARTPVHPHPARHRRPGRSSRYLPQADQAELQAALAPLARRYNPHQPVIKRSDITSTWRTWSAAKCPRPSRPRRCRWGWRPVPHPRPARAEHRTQPMVCGPGVQRGGGGLAQPVQAQRTYRRKRMQQLADPGRQRVAARLACRVKKPKCSSPCVRW
jgi:type III secretion protein C